MGPDMTHPWIVVPATILLKVYGAFRTNVPVCSRTLDSEKLKLSSLSIQPVPSEE